MDIYTDGSSLQRNGGFAAIIVDRREENIMEEISGGLPGVTNNVAELEAIRAGIQLYSQELNCRKKTNLFSDSEYAVFSLTKWYDSWKKNNWKTARGKPVKNLEIIQEIHEMLDSNPNITLCHIPGHSGHEWNEHVDRLAREEAEKIKNSK